MKTEDTKKQTSNARRSDRDSRMLEQRNDIQVYRRSDRQRPDNGGEFANISAFMADLDGQAEIVMFAVTTLS